MARGPAPKPTKLRILQGNPSKRRIDGHEPTPEVAAPDKPDWLGDEASKEWDRITPLLLDLGLLSRIDGVVLASFCVAAGSLVETSRILRSEGHTVEDPIVHRGVIVAHRLKAHPAATAQKESLTQVKMFLAELGLSPAARARIKVAPKEERDELSEFLGE